MSQLLNHSASLLEYDCALHAERLRIEVHHIKDGGRLLDFGVDATGGLQAGIELARICMSGQGDISIVPGEIDGIGWPHVFVQTDDPVAACLYSQYAGWQIVVDKFFAMGSGPMRAAACLEDLFDKLSYSEMTDAIVGVLEGGTLPDAAVFQFIADKANVAPENITLAIAPTSSQAGNLQVVARSVETCLHKLFELGFDVTRIVSGCGSAPLSPVAGEDLSGIGRTNDAILYGGRVTLMVRGDDDSLKEIGPKVPADASAAYGKPFLEIFEAAGRDFYAIDPHLFSPAEVVLQNIETGNVFRFGKCAPEIVRQSFGI
jgi:methenyltetrahydromethanopterin cyclohydrolase